ncbi:MadC family VWA domain-containing protein [Gordonia soli]|uniref:MadC family VWA domain-containing protein n=1 Tax=Gordonia soli TaxID=320799 RepID=UPI0003487335
MLVGTRPDATGRDEVLDLVAVAFGRLLRGVGVGASPAEVIELRRTVAIVGAGDLDVLRIAWRSVAAKYAFERSLFDRAFDGFFGIVDWTSDVDGDLPRPRGVAAELPDDVVWDDDFEGAGRMIGADEHTDEIGDLMVDDPDARERSGESAHREENDFSVSSGSEELGVDTDGSSVSGGVTYTVDLDHADADVVGEMVGSTARVEGTSIGVVDAAGILRAIDAMDGRGAYGPDGAEGLDERRRAELETALAAFVEALAERLNADGSAAEAVADGSGSDAGPVSSDQADIDRACHRLVQRMRGAPRRSVRRTDKGSLDIRATMRAAAATDGVPVALWRRRPRPGPVRLLVVVDVSLSVRPVTGFILRLAQTLHRFGDRCEVIAFVDRPVRVTETLRAAQADRALASVLADDAIDLAATSDYGRLLDGLLTEFGDLLTRRTSVLVVGDGRSNGFDPRVDLVAELARRTHRLAWVTPEPSRYWSQTGCALADYEEHCDGVVSARDGAEMIHRCDELGAALR